MGFSAEKRNQIELNRICLMRNGCGCFNDVVHNLGFPCQSVCKFVSQFPNVSFDMALNKEMLNEHTKVILTKKSVDFIDWYNLIACKTVGLSEEQFELLNSIPRSNRVQRAIQIIRTR